MTGRYVWRVNTRLQDLYANVAVHATEDREHEAAVELLLLVMIVDHHISSDELDEIRNISEESGWESETFSFDQYLGPAMAKVVTTQPAAMSQSGERRRRGRLLCE